MTTFNCPRHGSYVGKDTQSLQPFEDASAVTLKARAECPHCAAAHVAAIEDAKGRYDRDRRLHARWSASDVPRRYENRTLANWRPQRGQELVKQMIDAWVNGMDDHVDSGRGLMLMGAPGTGKTHLLSALCLAAIERGYEAKYASWPSVWSMFRPPLAKQREEVFAELSAIRLLMLDGVGVGSASERERSRLFELVDARYSQELPTIIATNLAMSALGSIGERTADRLREACIPIVIEGESYREQAGQERFPEASPYPRPRRPVVVSMVAVNGEDVERRWHP